MAGTGRVTERIVASGLDVTCVDASLDMLAYFRRKRSLRSAQPVCADVRALPFNRRFVLAILPFNAFSELVSEEDRRVALRSIHAALAPGARFICTLHNPSVRMRSVSLESRVISHFEDPSGRGEVTFTVVSRFDKERAVVLGTQTFTTRSEGETREEICVPFEFCLPTADWFSAVARSAGFVVEALYGDYDRSEYDEEASRFMIWSLAKNV